MVTGDHMAFFGPDARAGCGEAEVPCADARRIGRAAYHRKRQFDCAATLRRHVQRFEAALRHHLAVLLVGPAGIEAAQVCEKVAVANQEKTARHIDRLDRDRLIAVPHLRELR